MNKYLLTLIALYAACLTAGVYFTLNRPTPILVFSAVAVCLTAIGFLCARLLRARK